MSDQDALSRIGKAPRSAFRRFVNFLLIVVAIVLSGVLILILIGVNLTRERDEEKVQVLIDLDPKICDDTNFPIAIIVRNGSSKKIEHTRVRLTAKRKGRSTDVAEHHALTDDHIINPGDFSAQCWRVRLKDGVTENARELEWAVGYEDITFAP